LKTKRQKSKPKSFCRRSQNLKIVGSQAASSKAERQTSGYFHFLLSTIIFSLLRLFSFLSGRLIVLSSGMQLLKDIREAVLHLAFPHVCCGCSSDLLPLQNLLCLHCLERLSPTNFHFYPANPIEKIFWGRIPVTYATAQYYFTRGGLIQKLMHQFKYHGDRDLGFYLGQLMGGHLAATNRFLQADLLVPLPLFPAKERKRGFNQAAVLCEGIASVLQKPVLHNAVARITATESQTRKNRVGRWQNMEGRFVLEDQRSVSGKHVLLVDDVVTTGATLEACGGAILESGDTQLSIATLCFSAG
jgi:ComF family protein